MKEIVNDEIMRPVFQDEAQALRRQLNLTKRMSEIAIANMEAIIKEKDAQIRKLRKGNHANSQRMP